MKKYILILFFGTFFFFGCAKDNLATFDVATITDLTTLEKVVGEVSVDMNKEHISLEAAQTLLDQLQQKYVELMNGPNSFIEAQFDTLQKTFDKKSFVPYMLPLWAKKLGMTYPKQMTLDKSSFKTNITDEQNSTTLVYTGSYTIALQQAKIIAEKANLHLSKGFLEGQTLAKIGNVNYISGLDIGGLTQGVIYLNHELLETKMDNFLSVSVEQNGNLTIEVTKYNK